MLTLPREQAQSNLQRAASFAPEFKVGDRVKHAATGQHGRVIEVRLTHPPFTPQVGYDVRWTNGVTGFNHVEGLVGA